MLGGEGNDNLDGGPGTDDVSGWSGYDACLNAERVRGCEAFDAATA